MHLTAKRSAHLPKKSGSNFRPFIRLSVGPTIPSASYLRSAGKPDLSLTLVGLKEGALHVHARQSFHETRLPR